MHKTIQNLIYIKKEIKSKISEMNFANYNPKIIAISKTFKIDHILPLIQYGHYDFGESKVQEGIEKWTDIKNENKNIQLHLVGKLQTNKVKNSLKIFEYIHSLDNLKLAEKIANEQKKINKKPKLFIQINLGDENHKSGISKNNLNDFYKSCMDMDLDIIGTMCLPPHGKNPNTFFLEMKKLNDSINLNEISMGMSGDYLNAIEYSATYLRIGSKIFGKRN